MNPKIIENIIQAGLDKGSDFVEVFVENTRNAMLAFKDKKVDLVQAGIDFGIGIRLLYGTKVIYGYTSSEKEKDLLILLERLTSEYLNIGKVSSSIIIPSQISYCNDIHSIQFKVKDFPQSRKLPFLKKVDNIARGISPKVHQVSVSAMDNVTDVLIVNSENLWVKDSRTHSRFSIQVGVQKQEQIFMANESPGAMQGFEFFENLDLEHYTNLATNRALLMLDAKYIKGKKMPVIMGNGFGGVIFHEACGHSLETEAIRKYSSPFVGKLGKKIANSKVTAIDDGTIPNFWGSLNVDDEGNKTKKTVLIENGILKSYLSDRVGAAEVSVPLTGSARRESYKYAPVSRMRNTYIDKGEDSFKDMITSVDSGLFAKKMSGGSVNPATGEFNFSVEEGYFIDKGKVSYPVRGTTLIGKGHEILPLISMIGDDLEMAAGICGASSGYIPTTVGQPSLKVDHILVGGR